MHVNVCREIQIHTGAKLVVMSDNLPSCAQEEDELLEIRGRAQSVMQAVQTCCTLIRVNMARSQAKEASAAMSASGSPPNHRCTDYRNHAIQVMTPVGRELTHCPPSRIGSPMHESMHHCPRMMMPPAMMHMMARPGMPMHMPGMTHFLFKSTTLEHPSFIFQCAIV